MEMEIDLAASARIWGPARRLVMQARNRAAIGVLGVFVREEGSS